MRELYIGGMAQGKLDYVREKMCVEGVTAKYYDCGAWRTDVPAVEKNVEATGGNDATAVGVFYHFHLWVRHMILTGMDAEQAFARFLECYPDWILISDEVGNGIVPMEKAEREYRECLGRLLIEAAKRADRVERILCGLGQRIK